MKAKDITKIQKVTFEMAGKMAKGELIKENKKTVLVRLEVFGKDIIRNKEKHNVRIWPVMVNPIV